MNKSKILLLIILLSFASGPKLSAQEHRLAVGFLFNLAEGHFKDGRYAQAKSELEKCLKINPQHQPAKELLQWCEEKTVKSIPPEKRHQIKVVSNSATKFTKDELREKAMLLALEEVEKKVLPEKTSEEKPPVPPPQGAIPEEESLAPPIQKGAWTLKEGEIYAETYTKYYWHKHQFDDNGEKKRWDYDGKGNEIKTELKMEYGLTDRYTLMLYTVAKEGHWKDSFNSYTKKGFVEMWPGVKYFLFEDPFICSLQGKIKFPFDYSEEATPALGTHQIDGEIKLLTAQPWPNLPGYTKFELGFRGRNEEPTNEIPYFFELGYNLTPDLILKTTLDGQEGLASTGGTDEDWIKYTVGPIFKIGDIVNIELGYGHTFYGKNTSAAKEVFVTLSRQW